jgi:hypothetical protein
MKCQTAENNSDGLFIFYLFGCDIFQIDREQ